MADLSQTISRVAENKENAALAIEALWKVAAFLFAALTALGYWAARIFWKEYVARLEALKVSQVALAETQASLTEDVALLKAFGRTREECSDIHADFERVVRESEETTRAEMREGFRDVHRRLDDHLGKEGK